MLMNLRMAFCAICILSASVPAHSAPQTLPDNVVPVHYDLALSPDVKSLTWRGTVVIALDVKTATADVTLNADGLAFDRAVIDGNRVGVPSFDTRLGRAALHFAAAIAPGRHTLSIAYHGKLGRETLGFFAMDYSTPAGLRRTLGTNFEPSYARRLLPCWDEPARKATFTIMVDAPRDRMAVSNMPVATITPVPGNMQRVRFATTPKMSTYLLFLTIGDFERIHGSVDAVDVGVVVKRGDTAKASYALEQAKELLHYYDSYFGVRFPLPKLDLIAAPGDIEGDSMENWGAIFYSQGSLLFDPAKSTERDRQRVFLVVSHEMSHQWFGDLVTMAWWDNLWLNEGFARWMQTYAADALHPEWKTGLQAQSIFENGKRQDALPSTHPVLQTVNSAEQANQAFDNITYNKGAAVVTMLNAYIGRDTFREGVRRYMRAHAYGNTVDSDLWRIMQSVASKPVLEIERDFTRTEGVPLVRVTLTPPGLHLAEDRFFADPSSAVAQGAHHWVLPLAVAAPGRTPRTILLDGTADVAQRPPMLVNAGQQSYARVFYPQPAIGALLPEIQRLGPADQFGLMNDSLALGLAGYAPASNVLAVVQRLGPGADPVVWKRVTAIMTDLDRHYADRPDRAIFRAMARNLLSPVAQRIGTVAHTGEDANVAVLRDAVIQSLGLFGDSAVTQSARIAVTSGNGTAEQQRTALTVAAAQADETTFAMLLSRARKTSEPLEKERIYNALAGVQDAALATRMIAIALTSELPSGSNAGVIIAIALNHPDLVWNEAIPHLGEPGPAIGKVLQWEIAAAGGGLSADPSRIRQIEDYAQKNVPAEARKPFAGAVAAIRQNQRIAAVVLPELDRFIVGGRLTNAAHGEVHPH
jgi:aminopeptidase N